MATPRGRRAILGSSVSILAVIVGAVLLSLGVASAGRVAPPSPSAAAIVPAAVIGSARPSLAASEVTSPAPSASTTPVDASAAPSQAPASPHPSPSATPTAAPPTVPPGGNPALAARLQAVLDGWRTKSAVPGVSAAITFADGSIWQGTSGLANVATKRPVTVDTAFALASVSKTFLSAAAMQLVESGDLGLDGSALAYLPSLPIDRRITIRMLLDHTSGLQDFFATPKIDKLLQGDRGERWDAAMALRYMDGPYFKPGRGWHYSNTNYLVLGLIVEQVTGKPLGTVFQERLFEPLGLDHTWYQPSDPPVGPVAHAYQLTGTLKQTRAKDLSDGSPVTPFTSVVTAAGGAGAIASTATDLATWGRALYGDRTVLGDKAMRLLIDDASRTARFHPYVPYGLGVQVVKVDGHPTLGHSGRLLGSRSDVRFVTDAGVSIAVLTNQSRADPRVLSQQLLRVVLPPAVPHGTPSHAPSPKPSP